MDGFINFHKQKNFTSHDAVNVVRKIFQTKKVGHGGTLDPAAEGVLPEQTPPKYSAIKISGRKAYDLARKNIDFEIPARLVKINSFKILQVEKNFVTVEVDCAKGTYIRSLAVDFGKFFKIPATLKSLQRTRVGKFFLQDSADVENLKITPQKFLQPIESCLDFEKFNLPSHRVKAFCSGLSTTVKLSDKIVKVYDDEKFLGVGKISDGELKSEKLACI